MALLQVNFSSDSLKRTVPMYVILPADKRSSDGERPHGPFKTLYLLHGLLGNCTDWVTTTQIRSWAEERDLAVVMPSGDNSFYVDQPTVNNDYGTFTGQELVELTRDMFPLSHKRDDTFIAGLSMGGYGAIRNGLKYYKTFGWIAGFSSALHMFDASLKPKDRTAYLDAHLCFGDMQEAVKSDKNPRVAMEALRKAAAANPGIKFPKVYLSCGLQDALLPANRNFRDYLLECGVDVTWHEAEGGHNWEFWNQELQAILSWLPLGERWAGLNSGSPDPDRA